MRTDLCCVFNTILCPRRKQKEKKDTTLLRRENKGKCDNVKVLTQSPFIILVKVGRNEVKEL
jgi:hypothetical protein